MPDLRPPWRLNKPAMSDPRPVPANDDTLNRAVDILKSGGLVAFPTETVYGLGADATNADAVAGIFRAKDRPDFNPLICHVPDLAVLPLLSGRVP